MFIQNVVDFTFIALVIFIVIKAMNTFKRNEETPVQVPEKTPTENLLEEIRDLLKKNKLLTLARSLVGNIRIGLVSSTSLALVNVPVKIFSYVL